MTKEQIKTILTDNFNTWGFTQEFFDLSADAILALPIKVPSDEDIMQKYPFFDEDIDLVSNLDNQEGAKWMKEEIIKRNQP